jgi:hypothetical protein
VRGLAAGSGGPATHHVERNAINPYRSRGRPTPPIPSTAIVLQVQSAATSAARPENPSQIPVTALFPRRRSSAAARWQPVSVDALDQAFPRRPPRRLHPLPARVRAVAAAAKYDPRQCCRRGRLRKRRPRGCAVLAQGLEPALALQCWAVRRSRRSAGTGRRPHARQQRVPAQLLSLCRCPRPSPSRPAGSRAAPCAPLPAAAPAAARNGPAGPKAC